MRVCFEKAREAASHSLTVFLSTHVVIKSHVLSCVYGYLAE